MENRLLLPGKYFNKSSFGCFIMQQGRLFQGVLHFIVAVVVKQKVNAQLAVAGPFGQFIGAQGDLEAVAA